MSFKNRAKYYIEKCTRGFLQVPGYFVPVKKNRILFYSFTGSQYSCSPKYISEYLSQKYPGQFDIIWAVRSRDKQQLLPCNVKSVLYQSPAFFYYHLSAHFIISNIYPFHLLNKKPGQVMIDTWHGGGAYKKAGKDLACSGSRKQFDRTMDFYKKNISVFLSSSQLFTEYFIHGGMNFYGQILNTGLPRNDIFFLEEEKKQEIRREVLKKLGITEDTRLILYAPTWRSQEEYQEFDLDVSALTKAAASRFGGDWKVLMRGHHFSHLNCSEGAVDASTYPDMQQLLVACSMLISDYSSSVWDYSLTGKPCFLYTFDLEKYDRERSFYVDIHKWGFPVCETFSQLVSAIISFDQEQFSRNMESHYQMLGGYDNGHACKKVAQFIIGEVNK
ncbi:MAG: CDP-glycerol glycerophosphotransferase family protein [Candidatus Limivicinus sp.]|jgi:CDP-glycerol glycerophosphotransferase